MSSPQHLIFAIASSSYVELMKISVVKTETVQALERILKFLIHLIVDKKKRENLDQTIVWGVDFKVAEHCCF